MNGLKLIEDGSLSGVHMTKDGYLAAEVRCARTGIQEYRASEIGMMSSGTSSDIVRVYRPEEEVFSADSMRSYAGKPATDDHPNELVNASNWKKFSVGSIGNEVLRDGEFVKVPLILMDESAIENVKSGKRQISMGYMMDLDMTPGTTEDGQEYDAVQRNLRMNHLAIVDKGRAGPQIRIGDSWNTNTHHETPSMTLKTVVVDGLTVETTDAGAVAIEKLKDKLQATQDALALSKTEGEKAVSEASAAHDSKMAEKDTILAERDARIAELEKQIVTGDALDKLVANRSALVTKAKSLAKDADFAGKADLEIMKIAVDAVHGEGFSADKSDAYIEAAFDLAKVNQDKPDPVRDALNDRQNQQPANDNGYSDYLKRLENSWIQQGASA